MAWKRLRRTTFAPRRPAIFPFQWGLVVATAAVVLAGGYWVLRVVVG